MKVAMFSKPTVKDLISRGEPSNLTVVKVSKKVTPSLMNQEGENQTIVETRPSTASRLCRSSIGLSTAGGQPSVHHRNHHLFCAAVPQLTATPSRMFFILMQLSRLFRNDVKQSADLAAACDSFVYVGS